MPKQPTDTFGSLASNALAGDNKLRDQTRKVFDRALAHADYVLTFGSENEKSSLMKAIVPQMMRALQDEQADAAAAAQRAAYDRMREAMRGDTPKKAPVKRAPRKKAAAKPPPKAKPK